MPQVIGTSENGREVAWWTYSRSATVRSPPQVGYGLSKNLCAGHGKASAAFPLAMLRPCRAINRLTDGMRKTRSQSTDAKAHALHTVNRPGGHATADQTRQESDWLSKDLRRDTPLQMLMPHRRL